MEPRFHSTILKNNLWQSTLIHIVIFQYNDSGGERNAGSEDQQRFDPRAYRHDHSADTEGR